MNTTEEEIENVDYTKYEDALFEQVNKGKPYQHFLNISSQFDCMFIRSILASMNIPTYIEGEHLNGCAGGTSSTLTTLFKIKLYILVDDYDTAIVAVKDYIKNKIDSLSEKEGKDTYLKALEILAAPYSISTSQELLGITILPKKSDGEKTVSIFSFLKSFFCTKTEE
ncbi:MAG: hypothetical protein K6E51_05900 [Treponema sp.]|nr:hypothetical protein [Treponema sp.]